MLKLKNAMQKFNKEELTELAKGVFKDDKTSPSIYADEHGTFRNSVQYEKMTAAEKKLFPFEFKNPNVKDSKKQEAESEKLEELEMKISRLEQDAVTDQEKIKQLAQVASDGSKKIEELQAVVAERNEEIKNARTIASGLEKDIDTISKENAKLKKLLEKKTPVA